MPRLTKKYKRGGLKKMSERAKMSRKKQRDINRAEKQLASKEKKLAMGESKLSKAKDKVYDLQNKLDILQGEVIKANSDLNYYKRQLSYSELQETE